MRAVKIEPGWVLPVQTPDGTTYWPENPIRRGLEAKEFYNPNNPRQRTMQMFTKGHPWHYREDGITGAGPLLDFDFSNPDDIRALYIVSRMAEPVIGYNYTPRHDQALTISIALQGYDGVGGVANELGEVWYSDIATDLDIYSRPLETRYGIYKVLKGPSAPTTFTFAADATGDFATLKAASGVYTMADLKKLDIEDVESIEWANALIPARVAWDGNGDPVTVRVSATYSNALKAVLLTETVEVGSNPVWPITVDTDATLRSPIAANDGYIYHQGATYSTVQAATDGTAASLASVDIRAGQNYNGVTYTVYRGIISFDTSIIPDTASITGGTLILDGNGDFSTTDFYHCLVAYTGSLPATAADYDNFGTTNLSAFKESTEYYADTNNLYLLSAGMAYIDVDGTTTFGMRSTEDINASAPADSEFLSYSAGDVSTVSLRPQLSVTYTYTNAGPTVEGVSGGNATVASTNHTVNLPDNIAAGELVMVLFASDAASGGAVTFPSPWVVLGSWQDATPTYILTIAYCFAAGDIDNFTVTTAASECTAHTTYRISGVGDDGSIAISAGASGTTATPDPDSLTSGFGVKDCLWMAVCGHDYNRTVEQYPSGFQSGRQDYSNTTVGCGVASAYLYTGDVATLDPGIFSLSAADGWSAVTLCFKKISSPATFYVRRDSFKMLYPASNASYETAHDATTGTVYATDTYGYIGQTYSTGNYNVYRQMAAFNAYGLPSGITATEATLTFDGYGNNESTAFDVTATSFTGSAQPVADDVDAFGTDSFGSFNSSAWSLSINTITFNATGLAYIDGGDWIKLGIRSSRDISSTADTAANFVNPSAPPSTGVLSSTMWPKLVITYSSTVETPKTLTASISETPAVVRSIANYISGGAVLSATVSRAMNFVKALLGSVDAASNRASAVARGVVGLVKAYLPNTTFAIVSDDEMTGWIESYDATSFSEALAGTGDMVYGSDFVALVSAGVDSGTGYGVVRGVTFFNTTGLPTDALVVGGKIRFYSRGYSTAPSVLHAVAYTGSQPIDTGGVEFSDFGNQSLGSITSAEWAGMDQYYEMELNAAGLAYINAGGWTNIGLRTSQDIDAVDDNANIVFSYASEYWAENTGPLLTLALAGVKRDTSRAMRGIATVTASTLRSATLGKLLTALSNVAGNVRRTTAKGVVGLLQTSPARLAAISRRVSGSADVQATVTRSSSRTLRGTVSASGLVTRAFQWLKNMLTTAQALPNISRITGLNKTSATKTDSTIAKSITKLLSLAQLNLSGLISKITTRAVASSVSATTTVSRSLQWLKNVVAGATAAGTILRLAALSKAITANAGVSGAVQRATSKAVAYTVKLSATLVDCINLITLVAEQVATVIRVTLTW